VLPLARTLGWFPHCQAATKVGMTRERRTAARMSVGLCVVFGLLGCATPRAQAVSSSSKLQEACEAGDAASCRDLGVLYMEGRGVAKDERRAATLFNQACRAGMSAACLPQ
jgi:TPR repeat protein